MPQSQQRRLVARHQYLCSRAIEIDTAVFGHGAGVTVALCHPQITASISSLPSAMGTSTDFCAAIVLSVRLKDSTRREQEGAG